MFKVSSECMKSMVNAGGRGLPKNEFSLFMTSEYYAFRVYSLNSEQVFYSIHLKTWSELANGLYLLTAVCLKIPQDLWTAVSRYELYKKD